MPNYSIVVVLVVVGCLSGSVYGKLGEPRNLAEASEARPGGDDLQGSEDNHLGRGIEEAVGQIKDSVYNPPGWGWGGG